MATRKTTTPQRDRSPRARTKATEETVNLARSADGMSEIYEAQQEAVQGVMKAQMDAVNTMMSASVNATATSWKAVADFWTAALPKRRKDD
ncbi:hypothetical protein [Sagittula marina]|nr:hypothetical protein [Sagittula marina]